MPQRLLRPGRPRARVQATREVQVQWEAHAPQQRAAPTFCTWEIAFLREANEDSQPKYINKINIYMVVMLPTLQGV